MHDRLKAALIFTACIIPIGIISGALLILPVVANPTGSIKVAIDGGLQPWMLIAIQAVQTGLIYGGVLAFGGFLMADVVGLIKPWRLPFKSEDDTINPAVVASLAGGLGAAAILVSDRWLFAPFIPFLANQYATFSFDPVGLLTMVLYGGIMEEIMLRLFFMSLVAWIVWRVAFRHIDTKEHLPNTVFILANITAALAFALGHLPATMLLFEHLTPLILTRMMLLNAGAGLIFGWLYYRYGLVSAIIAHSLAHIFSQLAFSILLPLAG